MWNKATSSGPGMGPNCPMRLSPLEDIWILGTSEKALMTTALGSSTPWRCFAFSRPSGMNRDAHCGLFSSSTKKMETEEALPMLRRRARKWRRPIRCTSPLWNPMPVDLFHVAFASTLPMMLPHLCDRGPIYSTRTTFINSDAEVLALTSLPSKN